MMSDAPDLADIGRMAIYDNKLIREVAQVSDRAAEIGAKFEKLRAATPTYVSISLKWEAPGTGRWDEVEITGRNIPIEPFKEAALSHLADQLRVSMEEVERRLKSIVK